MWILVPVSGGGMLSGIATACAGTNTKVVAVEPAGKRLCRCFQRGEGVLLRRRVESLFSTLKTVADAMPTRLLGGVAGLAPRVRSRRGRADGRRRRSSTRLLHGRGVSKQAVEPAGAVALAAALSSVFFALRAREGCRERGPRRHWGERGPKVLGGH